ncbi:hypothetical protein M902_2871 [Bacteriovorax sp. BAL6_X]|uniref:hypothetical protein n=1 Tax=Bacteriovorax sp. BAL6_X TaxID=1201290 RepID=UPI000385B753|nr:hypothetical protein [Bacteriovorax sp. BAL6_X]EPZ51074.1 hypothetical protein M902_2871 [Bacteriovorax sp. BAL6_X]
MNYFLTLILLCAHLTTSACLVLQKDDNGKRSHPAIKHYLEDGDKKREIVVKNVTEENCHYTIIKTELIQSRDGSYSYLPSREGQEVKYSLSPFMSLLDEKGNESFAIEQSLGPGQTRHYGLQVNIPKEQSVGSFQAGYKIDYMNGSTSFIVGEIYYSTKQTQVSPQLKFLKFDKNKKKLLYAVANKGNAYTFFTMNLIYTDPMTGFESRGVLDNDKLYLFKANIRNYLLPGGKTILSQISLDSHIRNLKEQFKQQFPDQDFPRVLNLTAIPLYGIDYNDWQNHKNLPLGLKSVMIHTN